MAWAWPVNLRRGSGKGLILASSTKTPSAKGGRPGKQATEKLGESLLEAARQEFFARGFGAGRMDAIARAAGTTKQTLYARYGSKEALFIAVSNRFLSGYFGASTDRAREAKTQILTIDDLEQALLRLADYMLEAMLAPHMVRMYAIIMAEAPKFPELARLSEEDASFPARDILRALLDEAQARALIRVDDMAQAMLMLQHMMIAHPLRQVQLGMDFTQADGRKWARLAVRLFLNGARLRDA